MDFIYVATGGFLGAVLRYLINIAFPQKVFPIATFSINLVGSFLIGLILVLSFERLSATPQFRLFFAVGLLGAFTTFSTYTVETLKLLNQGYVLIALNYYTMSAILGVIFAALGSQVAHQIVYYIDKDKIEIEREKEKD